MIKQDLEMSEERQYYVEVVRYHLDGKIDTHEQHGPYPKLEIAERVKNHLDGVVNQAQFFVRVIMK